jgi:hypothetical protein
MGRPIGKRFIGKGTGTSLTGGESANIASLVVPGGNSYSAGTTITFPTPPMGGSAATATITFVAPTAGLTGNGNVASVTVTSAGSGYLVRNITATFVKPANVVVDGFTQIAGNVFKFSSGVTSGIYPGMVANVFFTTAHLGNPTKVVSVNTTTGNITMSMANSAAITSPISFGDVGRLGNVFVETDAAVTTGNTIQGNAWVYGGAGGRICDIVSQKGSRRYRVTNNQGTGVCTLVASEAVVAAGGPTGANVMTITATESTGGTYYVYKLDARTATIWQGTGTQFANLAQVPWNLTTAVANVSVKLSTND